LSIEQHQTLFISSLYLQADRQIFLCTSTIYWT